MKTIRCFDGNAKPHEAFWKIKDAAETESGTPELEFYGIISEFSWFEDDITPQMFKQDLYDLGKGGDITVRMNSAGGDVIAASVIKSIIQDYPGKVTVKIDGLAASAATVVAMAGDLVQMQESAYFMIHDPWTVAIGNVNDLRQAVDMLKAIKDGIVNSYETKTGLSTDKVSKMMSDETWMSAREAQTLGFVDEIITAGGKMPALQNSAVMNLLKNYVNTPANLLVEKSIMPDMSKPVSYPVDKQIRRLSLGGM